MRLLSMLLVMGFGLLAHASSSPPPNGSGIGGKSFLYAGQWDYRKEMQTLFVVRKGQIDWTYQIPLKDGDGNIQEFSDASLLANGNVLIAYMQGARLIGPDKRTIWEYEAPEGFEIHVAQPVGSDRALIVRNGNPARALLVNTATNETLKEVELPTGNPQFTHGHFRRVRVTEEGTLLATHLDWNKVAEYDWDGNRIWELAVLSPWGAERLQNGNTLVSSNRGFVREYSPDGEVVWELNQSDVKDYRLFGPQEAHRLANGNTLISFWCPGELKDPEEWKGTLQALEVTPEKSEVWALRSWDGEFDLGPATCIQLLDEPFPDSRFETIDF
ncbi:hypothetical protein [Pelagicoccus sp. SDUM812003]|uniref:beta-propeller domain-containing protein n=1 Tax=Pelagicoccus sp. SDUM812003 TaxID=3041267 RepID=UPI00280C56F7|nr:hypothetical protein [Pelagicoccus sp. SDUM812003]MDQ8202239.1 hypothetical protein [Pelagicoccus sp. SDUM812003]